MHKHLVKPLILPCHFLVIASSPQLAVNNVVTFQTGKVAGGKGVYKQKRTVRSQQEVTSFLLALVNIV